MCVRAINGIRWDAQNEFLFSEKKIENKLWAGNKNEKCFRCFVGESTAPCAEN